MPLSDYAHWNEDAMYMWWNEEGKHMEEDMESAMFDLDMDFFRQTGGDRWPCCGELDCYCDEEDDAES